MCNNRSLFTNELISAAKLPTWSGVDMTWGMFILICALLPPPSPCRTTNLSWPYFRGRPPAQATPSPVFRWLS